MNSNKNSTEVGETINVRRPERFGYPEVDMPEPYPAQNAPWNQITEPTVRGRLSQIRETLATMELHAREFDSAIFGNNEAAVKGSEIYSFADQLADVGTRLACLCGFLATVNSRFGIEPRGCAE